MCVPLSDQPGFEYLQGFVEEVMRQRGEDIEFIVVFGSRARDTWMRGSDFDVLVGLRRDDGQGFRERLTEYGRWAERQVEPFVYSRSEFEQLWAQRATLLLEAAADGIVLFDRGRWAQLQEEVQRWLRLGKAERYPLGWRLYDDAVADA